MSTDITNCSVCSGRIGILPTARSVACPHCNAFQRITRDGESIELQPAEKFADDPTRKTQVEINRQIDQLDLDWDYRRATYDRSWKRLNRGGRGLDGVLRSLINAVILYFWGQSYDDAEQRYLKTRRDLLRRGRK